MRFLFKISFPVEVGNKAAKDGFSVIPKSLRSKNQKRPISLRKMASERESS